MRGQLVISNIKLPISADQNALYEAIAAQGVSCEAKDIKLLRKSLDARDKSKLQFVYTVAIESFKQRGKLGKKCTFAERISYERPSCGNQRLNARPVIIGAGPAGLFAALNLARAGYAPIVIERGESAENRTKTINAFWKGDKLNAESNVCFGEGGAGTFSDGKLNTGVKDNMGRERFVLESFVSAGAPEEILYWYKPHIGSDLLPKVVTNLRRQAEADSAEFYFNTRLERINPAADGLRLELVSNDVRKELTTESLILAIGHSARDTYRMLRGIGADMIAKPFAVGLRVEHPQSMINKAQYGSESIPQLSAADYKLTTNVKGRGVYSFCMCPGGQVVDSSSEEGGKLVNGMSYSARAGRNANSAIIAQVGPDDFESEDIFAGIDFQRRLEENAYRIGGGAIPIQLLGDYKAGKVSTETRDVEPDICGKYAFADLTDIFPEKVNTALKSSFGAFNEAISGFDYDAAVLSGVESRTSSPLRIVRDEHFESNIKGLFPCGEGAGYAGGIMSAAIDGLKVSEEIIRRYKP